MKAPAFLQLPGLVIRHRELLWSFIFRDLKARYEGSLLGRLWPVLNPLILFALYYFVFVVIIEMKLDAKGFTPEMQRQLMGLYIISGILPWIGFSEGVVRSTGVVLENGNLVKKIAFPSELLPIYAVLLNVIYMLIGLALFLVALIFVFPWGLPSNWPFLLLAVPLQVVFTTGLGLLLGALNIFIRDTSQVISLVLTLWFFTTPIVYPASLIEMALGDKTWTMQLNPMYHLMEIYRSALVPTYNGGEPPWTSVTIFALMAFLTLIPGYAFFVRTKGRFADEL